MTGGGGSRGARCSATETGYGSGGNGWRNCQQTRHIAQTTVSPTYYSTQNLQKAGESGDMEITKTTEKPQLWRRPAGGHQQEEIMSEKWSQGPQVFKPMVQACIDLRIPATGDEELDALIRRAELRDVAAVIAGGVAQMNSCNEGAVQTYWCVQQAAALIERCGGK